MGSILGACDNLHGFLLGGLLLWKCAFYLMYERGCGELRFMGSSMENILSFSKEKKCSGQFFAQNTCRNKIVKG